MKWIIKNPEGGNAYMVKSVKDGLYFELFTWREGGRELHATGSRKAGVSKPGFASQGRYPSTLEHAFRMIAECLNDDAYQFSKHFYGHLPVHKLRITNAKCPTLKLGQMDFESLFCRLLAGVYL